MQACGGCTAGVPARRPPPLGPHPAHSPSACRGSGAAEPGVAAGGGEATEGDIGSIFMASTRCEDKEDSERFASALRQCIKAAAVKRRGAAQPKRAD